MQSPIFWLDVIAGMLCIIFALIGPRLQRWRSRGTSRHAWPSWGSVTFVTLGLCTGFEAAASLSSGKATQVWYALIYVGGFIALLSAILALIQYSSARR